MVVGVASAWRWMDGRSADYDNEEHEGQQWGWLLLDVAAVVDVEDEDVVAEGEWQFGRTSTLVQVKVMMMLH